MQKNTDIEYWRNKWQFINPECEPTDGEQKVALRSTLCEEKSRQRFRDEYWVLSSDRSMTWAQKLQAIAPGLFPHVTEDRARAIIMHWWTLAFDEPWSSEVGRRQSQGRTLH